MKNVNRYVEAFKEYGNLVGLATVGATAMAFMTPVPLLIGMVAEAAYLLFYADSRWYQVRLAQKFDGEVEARREALKKAVMPQLLPEMRARFEKLETVRCGIGESAKADADWFREVLRKLDFLLEKWLQFASKDAQFQNYLEAVLRDECNVVMPVQRNNNTPSMPRIVKNPPARGLAGTIPPAPGGSAPAMQNAPRKAGSAPPIKNALIHGLAPQTSGDTAAMPRVALDAKTVWTQNAVSRIQASYDEEMQGVKYLAGQESDDATRAVLEKRLEVMARRREFVGKIGRIQTNLSQQLNLLEDSFGLISDEIRARPPQQVLSDIEDVVSQTNTMTQLLEEVAPYEQLLAS